ncbi:MAG: hypothetical protein WBZ57_19810, partial [Pseudomonas graminis]
SGIVRILLDDPLEEGVSVPFVEINHWPTFYDTTNGWVCVGRHNTSQSSEYVEFATNTIAVIEGSMLQAIWLRPDFE